VCARHAARPLCRSYEIALASLSNSYAVVSTLATPAKDPRQEKVAAMIKQFGKVALTMLLITVIVIGIVAVKSAVWIPHFNH
jgi:hypothetical protein